MALIGSAEVTGRQLAELYRGEFGKPISYGSLYTTLRRLVENELVIAREDEDEDGRLRYFKLTAQGEEVFREECSIYKGLFMLGERAFAD